MSTSQAAAHGDNHDDSLAAPDRPFNGVIIGAIVFTLSCILIFIFGTYELFTYTMSSEVQSIELTPVDKRLTDLRATEARLLDGYQWVDKKNDVVRIPVQRAADLVLREWSTRPTGTVAAPVGLAAPAPAPVSPAPPPAAPGAVPNANDMTTAHPVLHPLHRQGLPLAPAAPGKKPVPQAKPKAN